MTLDSVLEPGAAPTDVDVLRPCSIYGRATYVQNHNASEFSEGLVCFVQCDLRLAVDMSYVCTFDWCAKKTHLPETFLSSR